MQDAIIGPIQALPEGPIALWYMARCRLPGFWVPCTLYQTWLQSCAKSRRGPYVAATASRQQVHNRRRLLYIRLIVLLMLFYRKFGVSVWTERTKLS